MTITTKRTFSSPAVELDRYAGVSVGFYNSDDGTAVMLRFNFEPACTAYEPLHSLLGYIEGVMRDMPASEQRAAHLTVYGPISYELERPSKVDSTTKLCINDWLTEVTQKGWVVTPCMARHTLNAFGDFFRRYYDADQSGTLLPTVVEFILEPYTA